MAGDIFDHNRVKQPIIDNVFEDLDRAGVPIVILPGNHDCLIEDGVYVRAGVRAGERVRVIGLEGEETLALHDLGLTVWGRAHRDHKDLLPLKDPPDFEPNGWRVGIAHGHWVKTPEDHSRSYRIYEEDLDANAMDYLALGHWDLFTEVRATGGRAYYSGSPLYAGTVNLVEMDPIEGISVRRLPLPD